MTNRALRVAPEPDDSSDLKEKLESPKLPAKRQSTWKPQEEGPGAEIKGRVIAVDEVDGNWGKRPVLTLDTPEGESKVWASHSVLQSRLEEEPPAPGSRILIRYDGTQTSAAGHDYHLYSVAVSSPLAVPPGGRWVDVFNANTTPGPQSLPNEDLPF